MSDKQRDQAQDAIIQKALQEEEREKKFKKGHKGANGKLPLPQCHDSSHLLPPSPTPYFAAAHPAKVHPKGKTLKEWEDEEGGPVKESLVGMAQVKRSVKRKSAAADTDLVADVQGVEEELEVEEEDGYKLEPFNLKEERQRGHFDDDGNYIEKEDKGEEEGQDAWLLSDEAKVVSQEVLRKIKEREAAAAAVEAATGPMSAVQMARLQHQVAELLHPGETVTQGLRRLGALSRKPLTKRAKHGGGGDPSAAAPLPADPANKAQFDALTEAANALMDAGEHDIYSHDRAYLQRAAAVYIDDEEGAGPSALLAGGVSKAAYADADEDMFAEGEDSVAVVGWLT